MKHPVSPFRIGERVKILPTSWSTHLRGCVGVIGKNDRGKGTSWVFFESCKPQTIEHIHLESLGRDCVFRVREFVAECPKCSDTLMAPREDPEPIPDGRVYIGPSRFSEVETPIEIGSVVVCDGCKTKVRITNPSRIFDLRLKGGA